MCIRVEFHHTKNGVSSALARSMKSSAAAVVSWSTVSMRLRVNGPVSSISPSTEDLMTPRGPKFSRNSALCG